LIAEMRVQVPTAPKPKGIIEVVLATEEEAPTDESVVAGPLVLHESLA